MADDQKLGKAVPERVTILPELSFDMVAGRPQKQLGETAIPIVVLPPWPSFTLGNSTLVAPILLIQAKLKDAPNAAQVHDDQARLLDGLNKADSASGGNGLQAVAYPSELALENGEIQLAFQPIDAANAEERLAKLVERIRDIATSLHTIRIGKAEVKRSSL